MIVERDLFTLAAAPRPYQVPLRQVGADGGVPPQPGAAAGALPVLRPEHEVTCSSQAFIREKALAFSCAQSGLDCCYVGEEGPVYAATARLEQAVDKLGQDAAKDGAFLDETVMEEVLGEIRDIAARGGISCACGSKKWTFRVNFSSWT